MQYHPTIVIFIASCLLSRLVKKDRLFNLIALLYPIIVGVFLNIPTDTQSVQLFGLNIISEFTGQNKLIGYAFACVLFSANSYSISQNKKYEIIFGSFYGSFTFLCLLAGDYFSMFIGLELMMIFSSILIFIGGKQKSATMAKRYFLTHLLSSNMILIGIVHIIFISKSSIIVPIGELYKDTEYSGYILNIMLGGLIINIAAFPFTGWMSNYYPKATPSGFLYLIAFTSKLSLLLILKLFAGVDVLKYIAILTIIYSSYKVIFEDNFLTLLCYLSTISISIMLFGISNGTQEALNATICYLFIHIIYKSLLSISAATVIDEGKISKSSELGRINNYLITTALFLGIGVMINLPLTTSLAAKNIISHLFIDNVIAFIIILVGIITVSAIPFKTYFTSSNYIDLKINLYNKISLSFMILVLFVNSFFGFKVPYLSNLHYVKLFSLDSLKQILIILATMLVALFLKKHRKTGSGLNIIELIGNSFFHLYAYLIRKQFSRPKRERWSLKSLGQQIIMEINMIHTQRAAIFLVFSMLIIMLFTLMRIK